MQDGGPLGLDRWGCDDRKESKRLYQRIMNGTPDANAFGVRPSEKLPSAMQAVQTGELAAFTIMKRATSAMVELDVSATRVDRGDFAKWLWCYHQMLPDFLREFAAELDAPPMDRAESPQAQRWENTTQAMLFALAEHHGYLKSGDFKDAAKRIAKALQTSGHDFDPRTVEDRLMGGCVKTVEKGRKANSPDK